MVREVSGDSHRFAPYLCVNMAATYFRENVVSEGTAVLDCQSGQKKDTWKVVLHSCSYLIFPLCHYDFIINNTSLFNLVTTNKKAAVRIRNSNVRLNRLLTLLSSSGWVLSR